MYAKTGKASCLPERSQGFFGEALLAEQPLIAVEDEGRLMNYSIREHFLTRIFTFERFDRVKKASSMTALIQFHSENKYLLMAYHQMEQKVLGKIVANHEQLPLERVFDDYETHLKMALKEPLKKGTNTNMILHMFGYVSKGLSSEEKQFFLELLDLYNEDKKPMSAIMTVLYGWVIRFDVAYLKMQRIFQPYPIEILDVLDSGKGRL